VEGARHKRRDRGRNAVSVAEDICRCDVDHAKSVFLQKGMARVIPCRAKRVVVRLPVHFHNQRSLATIEIHDIGADWMLAPKFRANSPSAQTLPERHLRQAHFLAKLASDKDFRPS
jgi:hypothetical protein